MKTKKVLQILGVVIIILIAGSFVVGGETVTPAENRLTGKCKNFSTTQILPWYKKSDKCRIFWEIDLRFKMAKSNNKAGQEQDKEVISKLCSNLPLKEQEELFAKYTMKSCSELIDSISR